MDVRICIVGFIVVSFPPCFSLAHFYKLKITYNIYSVKVINNIFLYSSFIINAPCFRNGSVTAFFGFNSVVFSHKHFINASQSSSLVVRVNVLNQGSSLSHRSICNI